MLSALDKRLLNDFQQDFPLTTQPYLQIAQQLGVSESEVIEHYQQLCEQDYISRIGPVIAPNWIGASALVAMAVDADELDVIERKLLALKDIRQSATDPQVERRSTESLSKATDEFAAKRMNAGIKKALAGKNVAEI